MEKFIIQGRIFTDEKKAKKFAKSIQDTNVIIINGSIIEEKADVIWDI